MKKKLKMQNEDIKGNEEEIKDIEKIKRGKKSQKH